MAYIPLISITGDITINSAGLTAIGANKVTLAMMAPIANNTVLGNISGGVAVPSALTGANVLTICGAEPALGNPGTNGWVLSSTTVGVRSWIAPGGGGGGMGQDTIKNILASPATPLGTMMWASDLNQFLIADGTDWYINSSYLDKKPENPDLGYQTANRQGYYRDTVTNKRLSNCRIGGNTSTLEGAAKVEASTLKMYLAGAWREFVSGVTLAEHSFILVHKPLSCWIQVFSGDSEVLGLNGKPLIQGYLISIGAYPH